MFSLESDAAVVNLFSFHGFHGFLRQDEAELFLELHVLDCGNAATCMHREFGACISHYGNERCRLPISSGHELCIAFQSLYYFADDPRILADALKEKIVAFVRHCLCVEHAEHLDSIQFVADRMLLAIQLWQHRRVFMDEPNGPPTAPLEEHLGAMRLSQLFVRNPTPMPSRRPKIRSSAIDYDSRDDMDDSWGIAHRKLQRARTNFSPRRFSSQPHLKRQITPELSPSLSDPQSSVRQSLHHQLKGRAKSVMGRLSKKKD